MSQSGSFAGMENIALHGGISSTSDSDQFHVAARAVDGDEKTYWASDSSANQELVIQFGAARRIASFSIKSPAK